jgi:hypothetical protein
MRLHSVLVRGYLLIIFYLSVSTVFGQRYLSDYDSTLFIRDTVRPLVKRFENLNISGYMQPQFQVAQSKGAPSYEGGNFSEFSNNRFMLRRARLKVDYILASKDKSFPKALFTFQFDATERGVFVRDMFLRLYEPKSQNLSVTMAWLQDHLDMKSIYHPVTGKPLNVAECPRY